MYLDADGLSSPLLIKVGFALLHFLWQGLLIAAVTSAGLRFLKHASSNSRYLFALAMFGLLALLPPVTFLMVEGPEIVESQAPLPEQAFTSDVAIPPDNVLSQQDVVVQVDTVETLRGNEERVLSEPAESRGFGIGNTQQMLSALALVWAGGVCLLSLRLVFGWIMMLRVRRSGLSAVPEHVRGMCDALCMAVPVRRVVRVFESTIVQVPAVVGWLRPLVLVPANLLTGLSDAELRAILSHELAHLRRHDYLINLGQIVIENLLFYHPVVWWLSSRIRHERENCCDDIAADVCGSKVLIARALTTLAELNARTSTMLPAATGGSVIQRIRRLLQADEKPERMNSGGIGFGILCLILPLAVALWPAVFAADPAEAEEPSELTSVSADKDSEEVLSLKTKAAAQVMPAKPPVVAQNRPQPVPPVHIAQQAEATAEAQRILMRIHGKQIAADEREADEQTEQTESSKDWVLKFPKDVLENELAGVIVDANGQPLAGANVDLFPAFTGHETTTDDQGMFRYKFDRARKGDTVEVRFSKDGYSPIYRRKQSLGAADLRVILNSSTYLEGEVVDKNGNPVPNATVIAAHPYIWTGEYPSFDRETKTTTDAQGHYRLYLNPEIYTVSVISEHDGVERVSSIEVIKDKAQTLDLKLNDGVNFQARILDAESKEPIAGFTLYHRTNAVAHGVSNADGMIKILKALPGQEVFEVGSGTPAMGRGYYSCPTDPFGNWWSPDAKKPWHRKSTTETGIMFELSPDMDPVTIFVRPAVIITGKVTDPDGNPVAQATVAPARTGTGNSLTGDTRYSVETKDDGTYVMYLPPSGNAEYNLLAHDGKYAQWRKFASGVTEPFRTKPGERLDDVDIRLHRPATVRGRVIAEDGRSLEGLQVRAHAVDKRGNRYYDPTTKTNEDGTFEVSHIRPGEHFIQLEPFWLNAGESPANRSVVVELTEGETKDGIELTLSDE